MFKKIFIAFLFVFLVGVASIMAQSLQDKKKIEVITTLFPTYDFAKQIGKDKVNVTLLLPPGVESHTFEPKPADIIRISKADVFIYTGKYMEPWVEDVLKGISNKNLLVVDASKDVELMSEEDHNEEAEHEEGEHHEREDDKHAEHHKEERKHSHHHGGKDPHIWLDLGNAQIMVQTIADAFADKDPDNKDFYLKNANEYNTKLIHLDRHFKDTFLSCRHKTLIYGGHFAFGYFAKRYGLEYISPYEGFSPNAEPTPKAIVELIKKLKASGTNYVYYEELLDPKIARTIASETGAKLELLHGAHNVSKDGLSRGVTFLEIMEDNLKKLSVGLECSPR
jgi:zinc transport system substrate-binding protein